MIRTKDAATRLAMLAAFVLPPSVRDTYPKNPGIDALNYAFRIELSDSSDALRGEMTMDVRFVSPDVRAVRLDLANANAAREGRGMKVSAVLLNGVVVPFTHDTDELRIPLTAPPAVKQRATLTVRYAGTPATGLQVGKNRHGDRTFFSDNWPDKGRHWLPTIDHPYDKATSEFIVTAPSHYQVVSNGVQVEATDLPGNRRVTHWKNSVPIAPWLYVLGVARFAVQQVDTFEGKAIETWVYPQDRDAGFRDLPTPTKQVLAFHSDYVGPFAYQRPANIPPSRLSGGMAALTSIR